MSADSRREGGGWQGGPVHLRGRVACKGSDLWPRTSFCQKGLQRSMLSGEGQVQVPLLRKQKTLFCQKDKDRSLFTWAEREPG